MIPKRVYLRAEELEEHIMCERMVSCDAAIGSCNVEYTNLSQLWHDADEMPDYGSAYIAINNNNNICDCCRESLFVSETVWANIVSARSIKKWIYIADILPKGGEK